MDPRLRRWLIIGSCALLAAWLGWRLAEGDYFLPALAGIIALAAILVRLTELPADVILLGLLLIGYLVGNRGFAQLLPIPWLPLFPAEWGLAVGLGWLAVQAALQRKRPWRRDFLNGAILLWLVVGTVRVVHDVPHYGLLALRDYAMVYYAAFFFLAQNYAAMPRARSYLVGCIALAVVVLLPVYALYQEFPLFFFTAFTVRGVPLIYLKGDLVFTFFAAGSVIVFYAVRGFHRLWAWPLSMALLLLILANDSRATVVGLAVAVLWLLVTRRWTFPAVQLGTAGLALMAVLALASTGQAPWAQAQLHGLYDRVLSIGDLSGQLTSGTAQAYKGDNNRFRLVWWHTLVLETWSQGPVFGLGFGYDLAKDFVENYDPTMEEDFTARSPHSIVFGAFGRMGCVGLGALLLFIGVLAGKTWRALRDRATDPTAVGLWCAVWVILTSACFGVVLEGPMGAVVFWTVLGLANGMTARAADAAPETPSSKEQTSKDLAATAAS